MESAAFYDARTFRILADTVEDYAIFFLDNEGAVMTWSRGAQQIKGYAAEEIIGKSHANFYTPSDQSAGLPAQLLKRAKEEGHVEAEGWRVRKDGSCFWGNVVITAVRDKEGNSQGFVKIVRDITSRKLLEEHLQKAKEEAEKANRAKTQFLANMSHEIRTPLNGIIGVCELLRSTVLDAHQKDLLDTIRISGDNLLTVLNDVLDYSKIEHDRLQLDFHAFNLLSILDDVIGLFYHRAHEKSLELEYSIEADLPLEYIGDGMRIRQVLVNLVSNSIKFTERGSVVLHVSSVPRPSQDNRVELLFRVSDTGIGIAREQQDQLFIPFNQLDNSVARRYGGSGLGLTICRQLVGLMDGEIWVESEPGKGTEFSFRVVLRRSDEAASLSAENGLFIGRRFLVVDDLEANRKLLCRILRQWGAEAVQAENSDQTIQNITSGGAFDAVLVDYHMPDANGLSLARRIQALNLPQPLPLVLISSYTGKYPESVLREAGYVAAIAKPLRQTILRSTLHDILYPHQKINADLFHPEDFHYAGRELSILIVEDNSVNRKVVLQMLKKFGLTADVAADGNDALLADSQKLYDLILMDIHMPNLDGVETTKRLKERHQAAERPHIVALTADATVAEREVCLAVGMEDYLLKPITLDTMRRVLRRVSN